MFPKQVRSCPPPVPLGCSRRGRRQRSHPAIEPNRTSRILQPDARALENRCAAELENSGTIVKSFLPVACRTRAWLLCARHCHQGPSVDSGATKLRRGLVMLRRDMVTLRCMSPTITLKIRISVNVLLVSPPACSLHHCSHHGANVGAPLTPRTTLSLTPTRATAQPRSHHILARAQLTFSPKRPPPFSLGTSTSWSFRRWWRRRRRSMILPPTVSEAIQGTMRSVRAGHLSPQSTRSCPRPSKLTSPIRTLSLVAITPQRPCTPVVLRSRARL